MLNKIKNRKEEGFTIIEVLIVLAIAGLILLVVFLAVPALQRNSRNTSMKNDVQNVLGGVSEFQNVNSGAMPTGITSANGTVTYAGTTPTSIKIQGTTDAQSTGTPPTSLTSGQIRVVIGQKCSTATGGNGSSAARAVSAYFALETSSGVTLQCQDS